MNDRILYGTIVVCDWEHEGDYSQANQALNDYPVNHLRYENADEDGGNAYIYFQMPYDKATAEKMKSDERFDRVEFFNIKNFEL